MKFAGTKNFPCPSCGTENSGTELQVHRGLKCSNCGTGYIPVKIEGRELPEKESFWPLAAVGILVCAVVGVFLAVEGLLWLDLYLVIAGLLAGILLALLRRR